MSVASVQKNVLVGALLSASDDGNLRSLLELDSVAAIDYNAANEVGAR